jgi:hypothetical protein
MHGEAVAPGEFPFRHRFITGWPPFGFPSKSSAADSQSGVGV